MASAELQQATVTPETSSDDKRVAFDKRTHFQSYKRLRSDKRSYKRSYSFSGIGNNGKFAHNYKRWKKDSFGIVPPTKFLLGGNICDPLNLSSLQDEETNRALNAVTPQSSPLPTPKHRRGEIEVLIPPNIKDPLNLAGPEEDDLEAQLISPTNHKRRKSRNRRRKRTSEDNEEANQTQNVDADAGVSESTATPCGPPKEKEVKEKEKKVWRPPEKDKIVSPVVPQPGARKRPLPHGRNRYHSRSVSVSSQVNSGHNLSTESSGKKVEGSVPRYRQKDRLFQYGNYNRYYGYRNPSNDVDPRLRCFRREWFQGLEVLDVGCNVGHVTLAVAREFSPRRVVGIDIDGKLIEAAKGNVKHYLSCQPSRQETFPSAMPALYGPLEVPGTSSICSNVMRPFPHNISFVKGNYVLESDSQLALEKPQFDTIMCLSVTKWVQLNWGDAGLKRMFHRMFRQLRPGGRLLLEVQALPSYRKKKKMTETIYKNFLNMQLFPEKFSEFLLSEVGFSTCEKIGQPHHLCRGFQRPLHLFTKAGLSPGHIPQLTPLQNINRTPVQCEGKKDENATPAEMEVNAETFSVSEADSLSATPQYPEESLNSDVSKSSEIPTSVNAAVKSDCADKSPVVDTYHKDTSSSNITPSSDCSSTEEANPTDSDMHKV